ncbi:MAG TPA: carboxypeptidase regulatory-like domain-containing protein [Candidatus Acidoferrales bacterium]|nr:carboxypeptidase regulatory-like domain-containing protein [Candidatus Acidoferrales bacterium]
MRKAWIQIALAFFAVLCLTAAVAAADVVVHGVVTDAAGKPVRGAIVKATAGDLSISGYSQSDGRYEISVPAGKYDISADAYGFGPKRLNKDATQAGETNFALSPRIDVSRLSGAEIDSLLPDNADTRMIRATCISCHNFDTIIKRRGNDSDQWQQFLPAMTGDRQMFQPQFSPEQLAALGAALEKYFGPNAPYFGADSDAPTVEQIKHANVSDAALKATYREYRVPTSGAWVHSVTVDASRNIAWFAEYDYLSNKVGRFDITTQKFTEYPVPTPKSVPHTPIVGKDGRLWMALDAHGVPAKLVSVDPTTGALKEYKWAEKEAGTHTVAVAPDGNLWMSSMSSPDEFLGFDIETEKFKAFKHTLPEKYPDDSEGAYQRYAGKPNGRTYAVAVDSKGMVWFTETNMGTIARLDPKTGETTEFKPPATPNMNGIIVDAQDNVWFSDFMGNKLGKLEPKTKKFTMYQPPTAKARPYGLILDDKTGYIWYADFSGNAITRFDPKTEQFVEYPIPTRGAYPRFVGLDSKGRIWFGEWWNNKLGVLDPEGSAKLASR